jgi:hypothetical protein
MWKWAAGRVEVWTTLGRREEEKAAAYGWQHRPPEPGRVVGGEPSSGWQVVFLFFFKMKDSE